MPPRPKLIGDKDRLIPAELQAKVLAFLERHAAAHPVARMVVWLASRAGLRISEAVRLQRQDCDLDQAPHRLLIRGAKHRAADHVDEQPIDARLAAEIRALRLAPAAYVVGGRDRPYTRQHALACLKAVHRACGLPAVYGAHSWRHGYGTQIYTSSGDLMRTMRLMRHKSPVPTQKYIHLAAAGDDLGELLDGPGRPAGHKGPSADRRMLLEAALKPKRRATKAPQEPPPATKPARKPSAPPRPRGKRS